MQGEPERPGRLKDVDRLSLKVMFERSRKDRPFPFAKPLVIA
jgi:hypothetical protein